MSKIGLKVAKLFGEKLPDFSSIVDAVQTLSVFRDNRLKKLIDLSQTQRDFECNFLPESLKTLESWYFHLYDLNSFSEFNTTIQEFEECMAMYFGETMVRNMPGVSWIFEEFAFKEGKYEIGVRKGLMTIMLRRFTDHFQTPN